MNESLRELLIEAAEVVDEWAGDFQRSHRTSGEPLRFYRENDRVEYDRLIKLAERLREAAK